MNINLRELKEKDASLMLEWMHDKDFQKCFQKNMLSITLEEALKFCRTSSVPNQLSDGSNLHFAIVNDEDEYLGTISLKSLDLINKSAEYAIVTRKCVHGQDVALNATKQVLKLAFNVYGLHRVYLNVFKDNLRASKFYAKCGFTYEGESRDCIYKDGVFKSLDWYSILSFDFII